MTSRFPTTAELRNSVIREFSKTRNLNLNPIPSFFVIVPMIIIYTGIGIFLEVYVISGMAECISMFIFGSYMIGSTYFVIDYAMLRYSKSYCGIESDKKFYVLSNLVKSAVLFYYVPFAVHSLYAIMVKEEWDTSRIHRLSVMYAIPDFVSLILVKRMAKTTIVHHLLVVIFMIISVNNNYKNDNICRAIVVYAIFSTFSYLVNLLLASRFVDNVAGNILTASISFIAFCTYVICIFFNWSWQLWYIRKNVYETPISITIYTSAISLLAYDDILLTRWLMYNTIRQLKSTPYSYQVDMLSSMLEIGNTSIKNILRILGRSGYYFSIRMKKA